MYNYFVENHMIFEDEELNLSNFNIKEFPYDSAISCINLKKLNLSNNMKLGCGLDG